jgi:hypothetical protein
MISRMVLVGLVAVLGVSLPSRSEPGGWLTSAHDWVVAQLVEWDTYTPGEECCVTVTELPDLSPWGATLTQGRANTTASVTFEPIPAADDRDNRIADELNRFGEGLDIPATTTVTAESPTDFMAVPSSDSIELKLAVELCRIAKAAEHHEKALSPAIPQADETGADPAIDELFASGSDVFARAEDDLVTTGRPQPASIVTVPTFERIRPLVDFESDVAAELNRLADGIEIVLQETPPQPARPQAFEPIKVPTDLESGIAYELNRASEGLEPPIPQVRDLGEARPWIPASEPTASPENNHKDSRIGKALGLTRDAALAWMNVLTGMTPVMMTSQ